MKYNWLETCFEMMTSYLLDCEDSYDSMLQNNFSLVSQHCISVADIILDKQCYLNLAIILYFKIGKGYFSKGFYSEALTFYCKANQLIHNSTDEVVNHISCIPHLY
jgi:hypothetical protein